MSRERLTHVPHRHNGDCVYCSGFSYDDPWWSEECSERVEFERRQILALPGSIRARIKTLEAELKEAERQARKIRNA